MRPGLRSRFFLPVEQEVITAVIWLFQFHLGSDRDSRFRLESLSEGQLGGSSLIKKKILCFFPSCVWEVPQVSKEVKYVCMFRYSAYLFNPSSEIFPIAFIPTEKADQHAQIQSTQRHPPHSIAVESFQLHGAICVHVMLLKWIQVLFDTRQQRVGGHPKFAIVHIGLPTAVGM